ncbi:MAG: hypothetical protein RLZZ136_548 [Pseudomonadota bacterium]
MTGLRVGSLPDDPLAASAAFYAAWLPEIIALLSAGQAVVTLVFDPASHSHTDWRAAAIATLAREKAPARINAVASDNEAAIAAAATYFAAAPAITGHYFALDGTGAGSLIG